MINDIEHLIKNIPDKWWRLNNLYKIKDKQGNVVNFKLNKHQKLLYEAKYKHKKKTIIILKARQLGMSTFCLIDLLDKVLWTPNRNCMIIAHEQDSLKKLFRIVRLAYDFCPESIRPELDRGGGSKYELYFPITNSRISCDLESRSDTITDLMISEYAFVQDISRIDATLDALSKYGSKVIESTPNGMNDFYSLWKQRELGHESRMFFPWFKEKEYSLEWVEAVEPEISSKERRLMDMYSLTKEQLAWRRWKIKDKRGNESLFLQEYPEDAETCFLTSGDSSF